MEIKEIVRKFIEENLVVFEDEAEFSDSDNIFQLGFVNSLFAIQLLNFIEDKFNIKIENEELNISRFSSVDNIVGLIESKL